MLGFSSLAALVTSVLCLFLNVTNITEKRHVEKNGVQKHQPNSRLMISAIVIYGSAHDRKNLAVVEGNRG